MKKTKFLEAVLGQMPFLEEAGDEKAFLRRIAMHFPRLSSDYRVIERAYYASQIAVQEMKRETGDDVITHLRATCLIQFEYLRIRDPVKNATCLLHDIVEDTSWTIERVRIEFGEEVACNLAYLSKPTIKDFPGLSKAQLLQIYYNYLAIAPRSVWEVKAPDRFHNLVTLWNSSPEKIVRKAKETRTYYLPHAERLGIMFHELKAAVESLEEELKTLRQQTS